jgi:hypothetical protein
MVMLMLQMKVYRELKQLELSFRQLIVKRSVKEDHNGVKDNQNHWRGVDFELNRSKISFISDIYTVEQPAQYMFTKSHLTPYHLQQQKSEH